MIINNNVEYKQCKNVAFNSLQASPQRIDSLARAALMKHQPKLQELVLSAQESARNGNPFAAQEKYNQAVQYTTNTRYKDWLYAQAQKAAQQIMA